MLKETFSGLIRFWNEFTSNWFDVLIGTIVFLAFVLFRRQLAGLCGHIVHRTFRRWPEVATSLRSAARDPLRCFFCVLGAYLFFLIVQPSSDFPPVFHPKVMSAVAKLFRILNISAISWFLMNCTPFFTSLMLHVNDESKGGSEVAIRFMANIFKLVIVCFTVVIVIGELGYNINGVMTGLGLGGLTFSLAAKNAATNLFSGLEIVSDKPFDVGDYIKTASAEGWVEDMSMRSTRVRTADDSLVMVPNAVLMNEAITNYSKRNKRCVELTLHVSPNTDTANMKKCMEEIKKYLKNHEHVMGETVLVSFQGFSGTAMDLRVKYFTVVTKESKYFNVTEDINFHIRSIIESSNIVLV